MIYRKGEISASRINRDYPHQIALPQSVSCAAATDVQRFTRGSTAAPRGHSVVWRGEWHQVYCFADPAEAETFRRLFDGYRFDPADRGRGNSWARWTPKTKPVKFSDEAIITEGSMCNLYSMVSNRQAIIQFAKALKVADGVGNLPEQKAIFPDSSAPIVRNSNGERELAMARWGMPSPKFVLEGKKTDPGVTNIRNTNSPHWRRWLGIENRCVVPFTSFSEYDTIDGKKVPVWFAFDESRPLAFFAGLWVPNWTSTRKVKEGEISTDLYGFLTCEPNAEVKKVHPKAMPVILVDEQEVETWMTAPWEEAKELQRSLLDGALELVGQGERQDEKGEFGV